MDQTAKCIPVSRVGVSETNLDPVRRDTTWPWASGKEGCVSWVTYWILRRYWGTNNTLTTVCMHAVYIQDAGPDNQTGKPSLYSRTHQGTRSRNKWHKLHKARHFGINIPNLCAEWENQKHQFIFNLVLCINRLCYLTILIYVQRCIHSLIHWIFWSDKSSS